jgi:hypothetical protein
MNLNLPGSRPPASYCGFTLPASANNPMPWSRPPWPQIYPYSGFTGQAFPGFWPFGGNIEPVNMKLKWWCQLALRQCE